MITKCYTEVIRLSTFQERYEYLKLGGVFGKATFGFDRYINQAFYKSKEWLTVRNHVIVRDNACDLAIPNRDILAGIRVHHMNPITIEDFEDGNNTILDPEFLICVSLDTHNAIHFGNESSLMALPRERRKGDMTPWKVF